MPSLVATMRPTSVATSVAPKFLSLSLMTSEISFVLIPNLLLLLRGFRQPAAQLLQAGGDAGVDEAVSVLELEPAEDVRVDLDAHGHFLAEALRELGGDAVPLLAAKLDRGGDRRAHAPGCLVGKTLVLLDDAVDFFD